jgi:hypothetical protein
MILQNKQINLGVGQGDMLLTTLFWLVTGTTIRTLYLRGNISIRSKQICTCLDEVATR